MRRTIKEPVRATSYFYSSFLGNEKQLFLKNKVVLSSRGHVAGEIWIEEKMTKHGNTE
jgi:hypothetical protein